MADDQPTAAVLTVSDSAFHGRRDDLAGPAVRAFLEAHDFRVVATEIVPDEQIQIENALIRIAEQNNAELVVSTGGTGLAERDVTPEATYSVCDRMVDGLPERMRIEGARKTPLAALSRAACGVRGHSLILNLPGNPKAATESLAAVIDLLPHALELLRGKTEHSVAGEAAEG